MKKVIYTALIGDYDTLYDPEVVDDNWDYICFSNHLKQKDFNVWKIISIDKGDLTNAETSRYPKLCPHKFLQEYDISIYIDSNIIIKTDFIYQRSIELEGNSSNLISIPIHPTRNCVYKEAEILKYRGKDNIRSIDDQITFLTQEGFPEEFGLYENNVIWRRHMNTKLIGMDEDWWSLYMKYSKRDQLGLTYCLWKHRIDCVPFMPGEIKDHRKCEHFEFTKHNQSLFSPMNRWRTKMNYLLKNKKKPLN